MVFEISFILTGARTAVFNDIDDTFSIDLTVEVINDVMAFIEAVIDKSLFSFGTNV
jgi:hypothetical protein